MNKFPRPTRAQVVINGVLHAVDASGKPIPVGESILAKRYDDSDAEMTGGMRQCIAASMGTEKK
jgi:hypothetical protein